MKKPTKSIITSSLLAVAFGALSVSSTFALFTSQAETTIDVGSGEVRVGQTLAIQSVSELGNVAVSPVNDVYTNSIGGKTYIDSTDANLLHLENWVPGDKAIIKVTNNNYSNVTIKTRFTVSHTSTSNPDLFGALTFNYLAKDANDNDIGYKFMDWSLVEPSVSKISDVTVTITFPDHDNGNILFGDANQDNRYQNCNCTIMFTQQAVQGNAQTDGILDQMNAALDAAATTVGRNKTMHDALLDIYAAMPNLNEALIKTAGYVWNVNTDQFYYGQENVTNEYFKIFDQMPNSQTNSIYASSTWNTAIVNLTGVGFDAGNASGITAVNYGGAEQARTNTIRTNSENTVLTIEAANDTVHHYGQAGSVDIVAVAGNSYHENGSVKLLAAKQGHIKLEKASDVNGIYVYNGSTELVKDTEFKPITITVDAQAELPKLSRSSVEIQPTGTKVCTIVTDQAKDVYLFNQGIYEQIKTVDAGKQLTDDSAAWADDSNANTSNTQTVAQQLANEWNGYAAPAWEATDETRKLEDITNIEEALKVESGATEAQIEEAIEASVADGGKTAEEAKTLSELKGAGTAADPFLVYDYATMQKISDYYDLGYYHFAVALDKTDNGNIHCDGWIPVKLHGSFDGKGVTFKNVTAVLFMSVGYKLQEENILLKDFSAEMNVSANGQYGAAALIKNIFNSGVTTFTNVNVHGYLEGFWNMGSFYNYGTANYDDNGSDYEVVFNNCHSDATIVCASGNVIGGLFGHAYEGAGHSFTLRVNNSDYTGHMFTTTSNGKGNKYYGMTSDYYNANNHFYFDGVEDTFNNGSSKNAGAYTNSTKISSVPAVKGANGYTVAKQENAARVVVTITAQLTAYNELDVQIPNLSGITMTLSAREINELEGESIKVMDLFSSVLISNNAQSYGAEIVDGALNINLATSSNYKSGAIRIQVNQYDANGLILSAGTLDIATCANATSAWIIK